MEFRSVMCLSPKRKSILPLSIILFTLLLAPALLITASAYGAVIFQDNFDSSSGNTGGATPTGWSFWHENDSATTKDSITHYAGELATPGRGGLGKSLKIWRHSNWPNMNNYSGGLRYDFPSSPTYSNIFMRYYIKLPVSLALNTDDYLKSWRFNTSGGSGEIYLDFRVGNVAGDMRALGTWGIYDGGSGWTTVLDNAGLRAIWDGNWHCIEFQLGLNNRTLKLWVDGVQKYSNTAFTWTASGHFDFIQHYAIGNVADGSSWQNSWQAIEFDDLVISDTYTGPDGATSPPRLADSPTPTNTLFTEGFDDNSFASRNWFDDTSADIDTATKYSGAGSLRLSWGAGQTNPPLVVTMRKDFTASDTLYVSMFWRFNSNWIGSGVGYHPHLIYLLSDLDDHWGGLAQNYLDTYIEVDNITPRMIIQDGMNVNYSYAAVPNNLTATTENRDVAGCNGCLAGSDCGNSSSCYDIGGGTYWNGRFWNGSQNFNRNTWHKVEAYFKMNSISSNRAVADGIMWMKVDGNYVINNTKMVFRTNQRPNLKWRTFVIAPWIGDGSPQAQTMWIDDLTVATGISGGSDNTAPIAPTGLQIITN